MCTSARPPPPACLVVQVFLLLVSFVAVPWMLVPKPMILKKRHEASQASVSHEGHQRQGGGNAGPTAGAQCARGIGVQVQGRDQGVGCVVAGRGQWFQSGE